MNTLIAIADRAAKLLFYGLILMAPACGGGGDAPSAPPPPPSIGFVYEAPEDRGDSWAVAHASTQRVVAMPSLDLVVAVNSNGYDGGDAALNQAHRLIREHVLAALQ